MLHPSQMEFYCETSPYNISRLFPTSNLISITVHCQSFPATENVSIRKRSSFFLSTSTTWAWWIILEFFLGFLLKYQVKLRKFRNFESATTTRAKWMANTLSSLEWLWFDAIAQKQLLWKCHNVLVRCLCALALDLVDIQKQLWKYRSFQVIGMNGDCEGLCGWRR